MRGTLERVDAVKHDDSSALLAATLDVGLAGVSLLQLTHPMGGAVASAALLVARGMIEGG
ncbi:MAG: hypothetical protein EB084_09960 [Proteobacteria bacterium]|nr:hypothetical protein [Pseudomonadota bacterium]